MIKKLLSLFIGMFLSCTANAQSFSLYYSYNSVANGSATTGPIDPTPTSSVAGITSGSWTAVGTGTTPSGNAYFSYINWGLGATNSDNTTFTGSIDPAKYYELTLTPSPNYMITLTNMTFGTSRSATGVRNWAVRTNRSNFNNNVVNTYTPLNSASSQSVSIITLQANNTFFWTDDAFSTAITGPGSANNNICNVNFIGQNYTDQNSPYIIRIYAWNSEGTSGTFRVDSTVINGTATFSIGAGLPTITHDINASFKLYPNPSNDGLVYLEPKNADDASIEIVNTLGAVVAQEEKENSIGKIKLDLSQLPEGTYFVKYKFGNRLISEKLIISK